MVPRVSSKFSHDCTESPPPPPPPRTAHNQTDTPDSAAIHDVTYNLTAPRKELTLACVAMEKPWKTADRWQHETPWRGGWSLLS